MSVQVNGDNSDSNSLGRVSFPGLDDQLAHTARILYVPGTLSVFLDGSATPDLVVAIDLTDYLTGAVPPECNNPTAGNAGVECRAGAVCDPAEVCDGVNDTCPTNMLADPGEACTDDNDGCTADQCDGSGMCLHDRFCSAENQLGAQSCNDGIDSDGDSAVDCDDPDCDTTPPCGAELPPVPAPAMDGRGIAILFGILVAVGRIGLRRLRAGR